VLSKQGGIEEKIESTDCLKSDLFRPNATRAQQPYITSRRERNPGVRGKEAATTKNTDVARGIGSLAPEVVRDLVPCRR